MNQSNFKVWVSVFLILSVTGLISGLTFFNGAAVLKKAAVEAIPGAAVAVKDIFFGMTELALGPMLLQAAGTGNVNATVTVTNISLTVTDGAVAYGTIAVSTNKSTIDLSDTQTMTNDGNVAETFSIKGATSTPGNWNLGTAPSSERYQHQFSTTTGSAWVNLNSDSYVNATSSVAATKTSLLDLKIFTPTVTTQFDAQAVNVTVQASQT